MATFCINAGLLVCAAAWRVALPLWCSAATLARKPVGRPLASGFVAAVAPATWTAKAVEIEVGEWEAHVDKGGGTAPGAAAWPIGRGARAP
jgi:hypothetical protein